MTPEHNRLIDKYEALVAENASLKTAIKMHQSAEKIASAELTKRELQNDELRYCVGRAEGQLREAMILGLFAPETAAHIKAAFETMKQALEGTANANPACECGVSLSCHGGCRNFREKRDECRCASPGNHALFCPKYVPPNGVDH